MFQHGHSEKFRSKQADQLQTSFNRKKRKENQTERP